AGYPLAGDPAPAPLPAALTRTRVPGDTDRGESTQHHPIPAQEQKAGARSAGPVPGNAPTPVLAAPGYPPEGGCMSAVDSQPDSKAASAAAGSTRPGGAGVVTLPNLPARLAQLAAGLPDRGSIGVRLRLDPPSLGEIRVHVES